MDIIETIAAHTRALQRPLYAVTASAIRKADTPLILTLHWHGFHRDGEPGRRLRSVAGSAVQLNLRWHDFAVLDRAIIDAGWALGAWDVERVARPPWWRLNAPVAEAVAGHRAFADYSDLPSVHDPVVVEAPDQRDLIALAARKGYVRWLFRPRKGGCGASWTATTARWMPTADAPCPARFRCNRTAANCAARCSTGSARGWIFDSLSFILIHFRLLKRLWRAHRFFAHPDRGCPAHDGAMP